MQINPDAHLSGYTVISQIGTGQFGTVYRVRQSPLRPPTRSDLVCKIVSLTTLGEKDRKLAEQEVGLLKDLNHRNIVVFHDCFRMGSDQAIGIVMEYCELGDMRQLIKKQQSFFGHFFQENDVMSWFVQILDGVRYLHANRIIHRDLKTSNIFLKHSEDGKGYRCLIGDFGISRVLEETLMAANTVIGTPHYLSPEVCKKQPYTYKSDMWSLGVCLYEICALKLAFKGNGNLLTLIDQIVHGFYEPMPFDVFSIQVVNLVEKLLSKDQDERPSATDLMRDQFIRSFMTDSMLPPPPAGPLVVTAPPRPPSIRTPLRRTRPPIVNSRTATHDDEDNDQFKTAIEGIQPPPPAIVVPPDHGLLPGRI